MTNATIASFRRVSAAAAFALVLGACAADQTSSLLQPTTPLPAGAPRLAGDERANEREHARLVAAFGGEYRAPDAKRLFGEVAARLVAATERPDERYEITILDSPAVNAFALPSGRLYVTRGLLALANDTSEIAAVLAHEIAHVTLRHANARSELALRSQLVSRVVSDVLNDPAAGASLLDQSRVRIAGFSRAQELEADQVGIRTLAKAGYDPHAASRFLNSLGRNGELALAAADGGRKPAADMLSSHPGTPERIALATPGGTTGRGAGRRRRGPRTLSRRRRRALLRRQPRRRAHPRPPFRASAPRRRLRGAGRRRAREHLEGGPRRFPRRQPPASLRRHRGGRRADPRDGAAIGLERQRRDRQRPGLDGQRPAGRGRDRQGQGVALPPRGDPGRRDHLSAGPRLAWPAGGARARVQDLARPRSVRSPPRRRGASVPLRLQLVTAGQDDTVESLALRMLVANRAVERFLVLNGLERGARAKPGERYKIIAE